MMPVACTWKINEIHLKQLFVGKHHGRVILKWFVSKLFASKLDKRGSEFDDWEACGG